MAGCATAYGPKSSTGGYVEKWRSPTELEVFFHHNDLLTVEDARDLALRRAAELALEGDYRYLIVWGERLHRPVVAGAQYAVIQVRFIESAEAGALDALEVVRRTDELAAGRLSESARARIAEATP